MTRLLRTLTLTLSVAVASPAAAWEFIEIMNAYGDQATGIVQPSRSNPDTVLGVGCDGDRWRMVVLAPRNERGVALDPDGEVRFSFGPELGPPGKWQVRKRPTGQEMYIAPEPSSFVRYMVNEERKNADAVLRVQVKSGKSPVVLEFPLSGLRAALRKDLWGPCKLENYFTEEERDR